MSSPEPAEELRVTCLECGTTYVKPGDGGTVYENPGCPRCGYLGWLRAGSEPRRSGAGRLRLLHGRRR
jgi:hypothetical protein